MFAKCDNHYPSRSGQTSLATQQWQISPNLLQRVIPGPVGIFDDIKTRAGSTSKIRASQGPKWFFPKMPPFSSWHSPRHKSLTVVHDLLRFGGCRAIFLYLMLFSAIFFSVRLGTLGSILWAQTCSNQPHHGSSFCQAWPKEHFSLWGGWDWS